MSRFGSLAAAAALMLAGEVYADPPHKGPRVFRSPTKRRRRKGPTPKPSRPAPQSYVETVQAQAGFTTARIEALRRQWLAMKDSENKPTWPRFLESNRKSPLEISVGEHSLKQRWSRA